MNDIKLLPCPFCGGEAKLEEFYETCDGRGNKHAKIMCGKCEALMVLTFDEFLKARKDFNYIGGYYSKNKKFWDGMHQRLIDKWNTRKPMQEICERLEELREVFFYEVEADKYCKYIDDCVDKNCFVCIMDRAIDFVKVEVEEDDEDYEWWSD